MRGPKLEVALGGVSLHVADGVVAERVVGLGRLVAVALRLLGDAEKVQVWVLSEIERCWYVGAVEVLAGGI